MEQPIMDRNEAISSYLHLLHKINEFINGSSAMCEFILASSKETLIYDFFKALTIDNRHSRRCCDFKNRCTCVVHILMFYIYIPPPPRVIVDIPPRVEITNVEIMPVCKAV